MKKLLMFSTMLCIGAMAFGQKQQTDSKTLEVNFTPLGGSPVSINGIKFRKFTDDYNAIRLEVFLGMNSDKSVSMQEGENGNVDNPNELTYSKNSGFDLSIRPGIEKHFDGTSRLSPYVGAALNIDYSSSSSTEEYWGPNKQAALIDVNPDNDFNDYAVWDQTVKDGSFGFGLAGLAGMDFYFADNIYLGVEFGFGLNFTSMGATKYSSSDDAAWALSDLSGNGIETNWGNGQYDIVDSNGVPLDEIDNIETRDNEKNGTEFNLGPIVNGALRLGFTF